MTSTMIHILASYVAGMAFAVAALVTKRRTPFRLAVGAMLVGFLIHSAALVADAISSGHLPLYGMQEVTSFLGWSLVLYFLIVQWRYPSVALAAMLFPTATTLTLISALAPVIDETPESLAASPLLFSVHTGLLFLAYAAFLIMFMAGLMYVAQEREIKGKRFGAIFHRLPSLDACDSIGFRAAMLGFLLLTLGIAAGVIWSRRKYGIYTKGDAVEVLAYCTWFIYLLLLHYRLTAGWRGRRPALVAIVGFGLVVFSLVVVKLTGALHGL
jgi:ABC-type transport system involved in cytochrome c biogenesis permease subunit